MLSDRTGYAGRIMAGGAVGATIIALIYPSVHTFTAFLILACIFAFFNTAFFILVDSTTLTLLGERREEYGRIPPGRHLWLHPDYRRRRLHLSNASACSGCSPATRW